MKITTLCIRVKIYVADAEFHNITLAYAKTATKISVVEPFAKPPNLPMRALNRDLSSCFVLKNAATVATSDAQP